jgi:hypothetical protein
MGLQIQAIEKLVSGLGADARVKDTLLDPSFVAQLQRAAWPGNIRELRNHLERCVVLQETLLPGEGEETTRPPGDAATQERLDSAMFLRGASGGAVPSKVELASDHVVKAEVQGKGTSAGEYLEALTRGSAASGSWKRLPRTSGSSSPSSITALISSSGHDSTRPARRRNPVAPAANRGPSCADRSSS